MICVAKLRDWKFPSRTPHLTLFHALLFTVGAVAVGLIFKRTWYDLLGSIPSIDVSKYADPMLERARPEDKEAMDNIWIMIVAPIQEEFIFRFAILSSLAAFFKKPTALIITAAVFSLLHFHVYPPRMFVPIFVTGIAFGLTYLTLGLRWSILAHFLTNTSSFWVYQVTSNVAIFMAFVLLLVVGLWIFFSRLVRYRKTLFGEG